MNTKTQEAFKMAIETIKWLRMRSPIIYEELEAEKACKEALAQPAQEPVLPNHRWSKENEMIESWKQPAPSWQGLSEEEFIYFTSFVTADVLSEIEKTLREKNHA